MRASSAELNGRRQIATPLRFKKFDAIRKLRVAKATEPAESALRRANICDITNGQRISHALTAIK